ncbi:MAG: L,D-transpeptidase ErfK/SrfK [Rhodothermales bacterium]|jgi:L,D-transpeptidase ErfK/SrfK
MMESEPSAELAPPRGPRFRYRLLALLAGLMAGWLCAPLAFQLLHTPPGLTGRVDVVVDSVATAREGMRTQRALDRLRPKSPYLVVSTTDNTFQLIAGSDTLRQGICSTGSYTNLVAGDGQSWLFATPRGRFSVQDKRVNPVWSKPDWAFVEAGLPIPPQGHASRYERGVLGRYALSLGDGYLVHGTPYQRLLGQPVTHGCVRLGELDLEAVYLAMNAGAAVYIY